MIPQHLSKPQQVNSFELPKVGSLRKLKVKKGQSDVSNECKQDSGNGMTRKRRWGTSQLLPIKKPALIISTNSLKVRRFGTISVNGY